MIAKPLLLQQYLHQAKVARCTSASGLLSCSDACEQICSLLPSNIGRSRMVYNLLGSLGLLEETRFSRRELRVFEPRRASVKELAQYHDRDYLEHALAEDFRLSTDESEVASRLLSETQSGLTEVVIPRYCQPRCMSLTNSCRTARLSVVCLTTSNSFLEACLMHVKCYEKGPLK